MTVSAEAKPARTRVRHLIPPLKFKAISLMDLSANASPLYQAKGVVERVESSKPPNTDLSDNDKEVTCAQCARPCRSDIALHCRHRFCVACAGRAYALQDPNNFRDKKITCPVNGCGVTDKLSRQSLNALLGGNLLPRSSDTYASELRERELMEKLRRDLPPSRYQVPGPNSGAFASLSSTPKDFSLSRMRVFCSLCRKEVVGSTQGTTQGTIQGTNPLSGKGAVHCGTCNQMFCEPCAKSAHLSGLGCKENGRHALSYLTCDASGRNWVHRKAFTELRSDVAENLYPSNAKGSAFDRGNAREATGPGVPTTQRLSPEGELHHPRQGLLKMWHPTYIDYLDPLHEDPPPRQLFGKGGGLMAAGVEGGFEKGAIGSNDTQDLLEGLDNFSLIGESTVPGLSEGKTSLFNFRCPNHPNEPVQFRCVTCNTGGICAKCCIVDKRHQTHEVLDLETAFEKIRYELSLPDWLGREAARLRLQSLLKRCVAAADRLETSFRAMAASIVEGTDRALTPLQRFDESTKQAAQKLQDSIVKACTISKEDADNFDALTHMLHEAEIKYKIATDSQLCSWFFSEWMKIPSPSASASTQAPSPAPASSTSTNLKKTGEKGEKGKKGDDPSSNASRSARLPSALKGLGGNAGGGKREGRKGEKAGETGVKKDEARGGPLKKPAYLEALRLISESRFARAYRSELMTRWFREMVGSALRDAAVTDKQLHHAADYAAASLRGSGSSAHMTAGHQIPVATQVPIDDAGIEDSLMNLHDSLIYRCRRTQPFVSAANAATSFNFSGAEMDLARQRAAGRSGRP